MSGNLMARFSEAENLSWTLNFAARLKIVRKKSFEFIRIYQQIDVKTELERAPSAKGARNTTVTCAPVFSSLPLGDAGKPNGKGTERRSTPIHWLLDAFKAGSWGTGWRLSMLAWEQPPCQSTQTKPLLVFPKGPRAPGMLLSVWRYFPKQEWVQKRKETKEILSGNFFYFTCLWDKETIIASGLRGDYATAGRHIWPWSFINFLHCILIHEIKSWTKWLLSTLMCYCFMKPVLTPILIPHNEIPSRRQRPFRPGKPQPLAMALVGCRFLWFLWATSRCTRKEPQRQRERH